MNNYADYSYAMTAVIPHARSLDGTIIAVRRMQLISIRCIMYHLRKPQHALFVAPISVPQGAYTITYSKNPAASSANVISQSSTTSLLRYNGVFAGFKIAQQSRRASRPRPRSLQPFETDIMSGHTEYRRRSVTYPLRLRHTWLAAHNGTALTVRPTPCRIKSI